ncbi:hypothetical protein ACWGQ5_16385 [Streptomyces sp. NPDC055722]
MIEYLVDYWRVLAGGRRLFDETTIRNFVRHDADPAHNDAAVEPAVRDFLRAA